MRDLFKEIKYKNRPSAHFKSKNNNDEIWSKNILTFIQKYLFHCGQEQDTIDHIWQIFHSLGLPRILLEHTIAQSGFFSNQIYYDSLAVSGTRLTLEYMKMKVGSVIPFLSQTYGNYVVIVTNGWIYSLWKGIQQEGVHLYMRKSPIIQTQREEDTLFMGLITNTGKFTQNEKVFINRI